MKQATILSHVLKVKKGELRHDGIHSSIQTFVFTLVNE